MAVAVLYVTSYDGEEEPFNDFGVNEIRSSQVNKLLPYNGKIVECKWVKAKRM
jgi:hypothetical protein